MEWSNVLEPIVNLTNVLLVDPEWSPNKLHSPIQQDVPDDILLPGDLPFSLALPIAIVLATTNSGVYNVYINNITGVFVKNPWLQPQARAVIPLGIHVVGPRNSSVEHIPHSDLIVTAKMTAEAALSKTKPLLGWFLNTRSFTIKLLEHKHKAWSESLHDLL